jgi:hypothetical protein
MRTLFILGSGLTLGVVAAQGCAIKGPDPLHCANNEGDVYCAEQFPDGSRPFCELGVGACVSPSSELGCAAERPVVECYSPCGGRSTIDENGECVMEEESSGSSSGGTTETEESSGSGSESSSSTTGPMPCVSDEECTNAGAPFCGTAGECGTCDGTDDPDAACAGLDPAAPVCVDGACVQCTTAAPEACIGKTPVCDDAANTCVPCNAHDQCGEAACNLYTGACLPADAVVHVGPGQGFLNLTDAIASFAAGDEGTIIVHEPMASYDESVTVDGGRVLALLAAADAAAPPGWVRTAGGAPQLAVTMGSTVLIDGLRMSGNADDVALSLDSSRAWVDRSRIVQNTGGGIVAQNAAELTLRNCFVGGSVNGVPALAVDGATATLAYATVIGGLGSLAEALSCTAGSTVAVSDSIVLLQSDMPAVSCARATFDHSASELALPGTDNANVGNFNDLSDWFTDVATGNFSLTPTGAAVFADVALWSTGDPPTDIDGDPRPAVDGTPDYVGADVPQ